MEPRSKVYFQIVYLNNRCNGAAGWCNVLIGISRGRQPYWDLWDLAPSKTSLSKLGHRDYGISVIVCIAQWNILSLGWQNRMRLRITRPYTSINFQHWWNSLCMGCEIFSDQLTVSIAWQSSRGLRVSYTIFVVHKLLIHSLFLRGDRYWQLTVGM